MQWPYVSHNDALPSPPVSVVHVNGSVVQLAVTNTNILLTKCSHIITCYDFETVIKLCNSRSLGTELLDWVMEKTVLWVDMTTLLS